MKGPIHRHIMAVIGSTAGLADYYNHIISAEDGLKIIGTVDMESARYKRVLLTNYNSMKTSYSVE